MVDNRLSPVYPYKTIPDYKIIGSWKNSKYGTFIFDKGGEGTFVNKDGKESTNLNYDNHDFWFSVRLHGEGKERMIFLHKNDHTIYELKTEDNRWKSRWIN